MLMTRWFSQPEPAYEVRTRVRVTFAESPDLYLREEMC